MSLASPTLREKLRTTTVGRFFAVIALSVVAMHVASTPSFADTTGPQTKAPVTYGQTTGTPLVPESFVTSTKSVQAARVLAELKAQIEKANTRRHAATLAAAKAYGIALRKAGYFDGMIANRKADLDQELTRARERKALPNELARLMGQREAIARLTVIHVCRGAMPQAWQTSEFLGYAYSTLDRVRPGDIVAIAGCHFGTRFGTVTIHLGKTGQQIPLEYTSAAPGYWSDDLIYVQMPQLTGVPDQTSSIVVTTSAGQSSAPLSVDFVALRDAQTIDIGNHGNVVSVNYACTHAATDDSCGGALPNDPKWPGGRTFIDVHFKACCRSTNSTDVYSLKLANGWTLPNLDRYGTIPEWLFADDLVEPQWIYEAVSTGAIIENNTGGTTCWAFGTNHAGHLKGVKGSLSPLPGYSAQVAFSWHDDGHCSWVEFDGDIVITGPLGTPYW